ncbi:MAG: hypothetical protein IT432_13890 [Phycisphaerales bacterium]|nr:hypothetical protein [Phycisphaerales bacterium]
MMWRRPANTRRWQAVIGPITDGNPVSLAPKDSEGYAFSPADRTFEITSLVIQNGNQDTNVEVDILSRGAADTVIGRCYAQSGGSGVAPQIEPGLCTRIGELPGLVVVGGSASVVGIATGFTW